MTDEQFRQHLREELIAIEIEKREKVEASAKKALPGLTRNQVDAAVKQYVGSLIRVLGLDYQRDFGPIAKRVHNAFPIAHKKLLTEDCIQKYKWVQSLNEDLRATKQPPEWLKVVLA
jgi:hypothetical protein